MKFSIIVLFLGTFLLATVFADTDIPACICTRDYSPVCGNDGKTYANKCEFKCMKNGLKGRAADNLKIARGGECDGPEVPYYNELTNDL